MGEFNKFSSYDVFAYLASGFVALASVDFVYGSHLVLGADWSVSTGVIMVFAAYVLGQILAAPSAWLLEVNLVGKVLKSPSEILFTGPQTKLHSLLRRVILREYYKPLSQSLVAKIKELAKRDGYSGAAGEDLFLTAYSVAKKDEMAYTRMSAFLNLYGFCRNMAFVSACLFVALVIDATANCTGHVAPVATQSCKTHVLPAMVLSALVSLGMLHRYLKFFRHYAMEVFVTYARSQ